MTGRLRGIFVPAVTPFRPDGALETDWLRANLVRLGRTGVAGYMCLGSNGEARSLTDAESLAVAGAAIEAKGDKCLILGVGRESTDHTLAFIDQVAELPVGIDYLSVLTPSYFAQSMTATALEAHYLQIAEASPLPVLLYVAPAFANGVVLPPQSLATLARHPNIAGVKDTSRDMLDSYLAAADGRDDFAVMAGSVGNLRRCLEAGGSGGVVSAANYLPERCAEVYRLFAEGQVDAAWDELDAVRELARASAGRFSVAGVKACMNILGWAGGVPRSPVLPVQGPELEALAKALEVD
ncbi:MAG: dihydrodipicolinate synthase family protein [Bifidobacteriaceae bacterium]|nr:dihydrodipicolinate synthase family protein [Bifidobacteriaceae bacterium]